MNNFSTDAFTTILIFVFEQFEYDEARCGYFMFILFIVYWPI